MGDRNSTERTNVYKMFAALFYNIFTIRFFLHYFYNTFYNMFHKARVYNSFLQFFSLSAFTVFLHYFPFTNTFFTTFLLQIPFSL